MNYPPVPPSLTTTAYPASPKCLLEGGVCGGSKGGKGVKGKEGSSFQIYIRLRKNK